MPRRPRSSPTKRPPAADLLKGWLVEHGQTQRALAAALGVGESAVWAWTGGRAHPSLELAAALETLTGGAVPAAAWVDPAEATRLADIAKRAL